jgi:hypothetical protein
MPGSASCAFSQKVIGKQLLTKKKESPDNSICKSNSSAITIEGCPYSHSKQDSEKNIGFDAETHKMLNTLKEQKMSTSVRNMAINIQNRNL